ncbi:Fe-S cluster assembly ATPase SufC [Ignavigranum ruoffiae]|uniref:Fe-S cluster assembly ATP-binding protein n=1 Tax=Ignavigranum ruoffiae TaxID=89093 RepID=A0A1H9F5C9_9LACT|nr:Fe-S cluster assembly ATPase SufC [Ignavigranum ruoffiae]UPQ85985.1 Fe-S cluster assembly ATPase SufC [Ignavigranum ruoffiae]SEQ33186.1 Fe-S cluster assembly ATP-binding protein [Ignavigranum ruoffiae]
MSVLEIKDLHVSIEDKEILKGVNLTIQSGEIHAIMGPNGTGKSTLAAALMGNPAYQITQGSVYLDGEDLLAMEVDERARAGLFLAVQYPSEISGVSNSNFLHTAMNARLPEGENIDIMEFIQELDQNMNLLNMPESMADRFVNEGFSGGEKKRNEILQMMMLKPKIALLDEIDSGLDIDALQYVAKGVNAMRGSDFAALMITHYQRLLNYIVPDYVHIMMDGRIVQSGDAELAKRLEAEGYHGLAQSLGINLDEKA